MSLFVKVENEKVTEVWDMPPPEGEAGWRSAIEVRPSIIHGKQIYNGHTFDLTTDPVEIVYNIEDLTVANRKEGLINIAKFAFQRVAENQTRLELEGDGMDIDILVAAKTTKDAKIADINPCTTHDDLDALTE